VPVTTFFRIGLVFFGAGFVLVPFLHSRLVTQLGWWKLREFLDRVAIGNLTPGPIAVLATFAGLHWHPALILAIGAAAGYFGLLP
jgi:chromate transporter